MKSILVTLALCTGALATATVEAAQVVANAAPSARTVDARHFALNAAIWDSNFEEPANFALLRELGATTFRFPGGSISDEYHWAVNRTGANTFTWANSFTDFAGVVISCAVTHRELAMSKRRIKHSSSSPRGRGG